MSYWPISDTTTLVDWRERWLDVRRRSGDDSGRVQVSKDVHSDVTPKYKRQEILEVK